MWSPCSLRSWSGPTSSYKVSYSSSSLPSSSASSSFVALHHHLLLLVLLLIIIISFSPTAFSSPSSHPSILSSSTQSINQPTQLIHPQRKPSNPKSSNPELHLSRRGQRGARGPKRQDVRPGQITRGTCYEARGSGGQGPRKVRRRRGMQVLCAGFARFFFGGGGGMQ